MTPEIITVGIGAVLAAAIVRGFAGFGFSAFCLAIITIVMTPQQAVPLVMMMEIVASIWMLPGCWRDVDLRWMAIVSIGLIVGTPIGIAALAQMPASTVKIILYSTLIVLSIVATLQGRGTIPKWKAPLIVVGILVGVANGLAAVAGLVAALFMLSAGEDSVRIRASMIMLFLVADVYALALGNMFGLINADQLKLLGIFILPLIAGVVLGTYFFKRFGSGNYRPIALGLILFAALIGIANVILA